VASVDTRVAGRCKLLRRVPRRKRLTLTSRPTSAAGELPLPIIPSSNRRSVIQSLCGFQMK
jgi:hypothetical protein